jgi:hypothetical protein
MDRNESKSKVNNKERKSKTKGVSEEWSVRTKGVYGHIYVQQESRTRPDLRGAPRDERDV